MKHIVLLLIVSLVFLLFFYEQKYRGKTAEEWSALYQEENYKRAECLGEHERKDKLVGEFLKVCMVKENPYSCAFTLGNEYEK